jgi:hypothetical protein
VVDRETTPKAAPQTSASPTTQHKPSTPSSKPAEVSQEYRKLLAAKDETISVLKETVEDLKESNKQISTTLKGEIDLLKSAFSEMRSLYVHRIGQMKAAEPASETEDLLEADVKPQDQAETLQEWIGTKRFFKQQHIIKEKQREKILKKLKKAYKKGDERLRKIDGKLKVDMTKRYEDILN